LIAQTDQLGRYFRAPWPRHMQIITVTTILPNSPQGRAVAGFSRFYRLFFCWEMSPGDLT
jgi:hypothetical protein